MSRILIVEDEEKIARFVELELQHEGYDAEKAADGRDGLEKAQSGRFDLIILDIMLPQLSGIEVLRRLRKNENAAIADTPVILLTARDSVTDKVSGLDMGANDYVTKPFQIEELLARIRVILRQRRTADSRNEDRQDASDELECCGVRLNPQSREVTYNGSPIELTNREFILLKTLLENKNVAMSREKLLCEAWGYDYFGETNIIDVYVRYIRHKTADDVIKTIRGVGYIITDRES
ncbi:MAG: response regulator transcription factor [Clostridia bacterium]|nr:response regulator transcription factor [Clostridia bacterium]